MMTWEQKSVYKELMRLAKSRYLKGDYKWAKDTYKSAYLLAVQCNDNEATDAAQEGIDLCLKELKNETEMEI